MYIDCLRLYDFLTLSTYYMVFGAGKGGIYLCVGRWIPEFWNFMRPPENMSLIYVRSTRLQAPVWPTWQSPHPLVLCLLGPL